MQGGGQIISGRRFTPHQGHLLYLIYSYLTQCRIDGGLIGLRPKARHIIEEGLEIYAVPLIQPGNPTVYTPTGSPVHAHTHTHTHTPTK